MVSGRVLDSRPMGRGFKPHWCHCVVSLSKNINPSLVLVQPRKTRPFITERLLMGRKESNQTKQNKQIKLPPGPSEIPENNFVLCLSYVACSLQINELKDIASLKQLYSLKLGTFGSFGLCKQPRPISDFSRKQCRPKSAYLKTISVRVKLHCLITAIFHIR